MTYDPEHWLESLTRELKAYAESNFNTRIFDIFMEFPGSTIDAMELPMSKTIVHFEVDAIDEMLVGMGENIFAQNYDADTQTEIPQYASRHVVNFDVGVWASDKSGGITSRMRARQTLTNLFGPAGVNKFRSITDGGDGGIEIRSFSGGRTIVDRNTNDIRLYRLIDCTLVLAVYSRTPTSISEPAPTIEDIEQAPNLTVLGS